MKLKSCPSKDFYLGCENTMAKCSAALLTNNFLRNFKVAYFQNLLINSFEYLLTKFHMLQVCLHPGPEVTKSLYHFLGGIC